MKLRTVILFLLMLAGKSCLAQSIQLSWGQSITPGTTVNVYRLVGLCTGTFALVKSNLPAAGSWTDTNVSYGTNYCYYAKAVHNGVESVRSGRAWLMIPKLTVTKTCSVSSGQTSINITATLTTPNSITITCS
jgi:hypothetical protein